MLRLFPYPIFCLIVCLFLSIDSKAQNVPIGQWETHFSYNSAGSVEKVNDKIFAAKSNLYSYSLTDNDYTIYSKVNGLSDVNIQFIRYDKSTDNLLIVYENSNIDLLQQGRFVNIPDIKNTNITGSKRINSAYFKNNLIYLCTDFGIVVLNPAKNEIKESYILQQSSEVLNIKSLTSSNGFFYAATSKGIFKADESSSALQNFTSWTSITDKPLNYIFMHHNQLFCADADTVYSVTGTVVTPVYTAVSPIQNISEGENDIYVCERDDNRRSIKILNENGLLADSVQNVNPYDVVEVNSNEIWEADGWEGLIQLKNRKDKHIVNPDGAYSSSFYNLSVSAVDESIYVAAGGELSWEPSYNSGGISKYENGSWQWYNRYVGISAMDSVIDITDVAVDPRNKYVYASSFGGGLLEIHPDKSTVTYKNNGYLQSQIGNGTANVVMDLVFDDQNNLWMSDYGAPNQLVVKKADGSWQNFSLPFPGSDKSVSKIVVDDNHQKWVIGARGTGLFVMNDNNTIDNKNDDQYRLLTMGTGNGNLPSNEVYSLAKDRNGKIWVGTADGIGIFNCPESMMTSDGCDAELKIVKYDLNAGLLFQREGVNTIAIDGANNKWIGTNNGVWLITDDAEKIIHKFTKDNSPLPSNEIKSIVIQPSSGKVFMATNAGLVSYRSEATKPNETNASLQIFPNPVPSGFGGTIGIKGLVESADVRITDVAGQLVYRTKAQGGQATWNGVNYLGKRPRTGVYYVFVTNTDGTERKAGKFIFNE